MVKALDVIQFILIIFLIVFGIFIIYQITLKILGGSWETQDIIIALLVFNVSFTIVIALNQIRFNTGYNYFKRNIYKELKDIKNRL